MTRQSGSYGYKAEEVGTVAGQVAQHTRAAADKTTELGEELLDRADEWLKPIGLSIKEQPLTCLAVVGGVAFAAGAAFWVLRSSRQQSRVSDLVSQLSNYSRRGW